MADVSRHTRGWLRRSRFADLCQSHLDRISRDFGVTAFGVQIVGLEHMIVVASAMGSGNFQLSAQVGSRFPALISATGRCIAAFGNHSDAAIQQRFTGLRWDEPPSYDQWREQVAETLVRGYAIDAGNYISGITVIAAPVHKAPALLSHALVAIGIGGAIKRAGPERLAQALLAATKSVSDQMPCT